jgi:ABC-2 type transport system permease protein
MRILHTFKVILSLARLQLSSKMIYRFSFWSAFLTDLVIFLIQLLFFKVISQNGSFGSWNINHLTVFTGTFIALDGVYMATYFFGMINIPEQIRTGTLDFALVKPVNSLLYVTFSKLDPGSFLLGITGFAIAFFGGAKLGVITPLSIIKYFTVFILMYILMFALMLCLRCVSFWLTRISSITEFENTMVNFSFRLPEPAITGAWKVVLFILLPYGLMANMPSMALFGPFSALQWLLCISVTIFFLLLSILLWRIGLKGYDSASS